MRLHFGPLLICLFVSACNYNTRAPGNSVDAGFATAGPEQKRGSVTDGGQAETSQPMTATCILGSARQERLDSPVLLVADKLPVQGVAIQAPGRMLLKTATTVHIWDLQEGRQRMHRAAEATDAAIDFQARVSWPDSGVNLTVNPVQGSLDVLQGGEVVARIWLTQSGWAVVHASGRFDGDVSTWSDLRWRDDDAQLSLRQLVDLYYEPALLGRLAAGSGFATREVPGIAKGLPLPPVTELAVQRHGNRALGEVRVTDRGGCIGAVRVFLDGKGIPLEPPRDRAGSGGQEIWRFEVPVNPGALHFEALASSRWAIEGEADRLTLTVPGESVANAPPTLHVLAVGVDQYANPALRLNFATVDARAMAQWASGLKAPFGEVRITEIYDRDATRDRIREALLQLQHVPASDTVLIYLAGHGENDGVRWFFLPTEFGSEISLRAVTRDGLSSETLRDQLLNIPARHVALIVDACKSGDLRRAFSAATDERYLEWVGRTAGIHLLAATDQEQLAVEIDALGHGALTYVLLRGLERYADQLPADASVMVKELYGYVGKILPALTQRLALHPQIPMIFEYGPNFPLQTSTDK